MSGLRKSPQLHVARTRYAEILYALVVQDDYAPFTIAELEEYVEMVVRIGVDDIYDVETAYGSLHVTVNNGYVSGNQLLA